MGLGAGIDKEDITCVTPWSDDKTFEALNGEETLDFVMLFQTVEKNLVIMQQTIA